VAGHDPARDDGVQHAGGLREAGVPVKLTEYAGMPHGHLRFPGIRRDARAARRVIAEQGCVPLVQP